MIGKYIEEFCRQHMTMKAPGVLAEYPDIFAVFIIIILTGETKPTFVLFDPPLGSKLQADPMM